MDASPIPTRIRNVELTLEHGGETLTATPVQRLGDDLDAVLTAEDARSWCFVPLFDLEHPKKEGSRSRARREKKSARALAALDVRTRAGTLSETTAREGEDAPRSAPGVFLFDLRRSDARTLAKQLSVSWFYWGRRDTLAEAHGVEPISEGLGSFDGGVFRCAQRGLLDFVDTAARRPPEPVPRRSLLILAGAAAATLVLRAGMHHPRRPEVVHDSWFMRMLTSYAVLPALALWYLLAGFVQQRDTGPPERDLSYQEVESAWSRVAPELARYWVMGGVTALVAVTLSLLAVEPPQSLQEGALTLADGMRAAVLCLWLASASAWTANLWDALSQGFEQWWEFFVWVLVISIVASFGGMLVDAAFNLVLPLVPLPQLLESILSALGKLATKAILYGHLLGIGWLRFRESYMHWLEAQAGLETAGAGRTETD